MSSILLVIIKTSKIGVEPNHVLTISPFLMMTKQKYFDKERYPPEFNIHISLETLYFPEEFHPEYDEGSDGSKLISRIDISCFKL